MVAMVATVARVVWVGLILVVEAMEETVAVAVSEHWAAAEAGFIPAILPLPLFTIPPSAGMSAALEAFQEVVEVVV